MVLPFLRKGFMAVRHEKPHHFRSTVNGQVEVAL